MIVPGPPSSFRCHTQHNVDRSCSQSQFRNHQGCCNSGSNLRPFFAICVSVDNGIDCFVLVWLYFRLFHRIDLRALRRASGICAQQTAAIGTGFAGNKPAIVITVSAAGTTRYIQLAVGAGYAWPDRLAQLVVSTQSEPVWCRLVVLQPAVDVLCLLPSAGKAAS